jgi:dihydrodipicolinate synthase/N-acetylneuraminate lyase
MNDVLHGIFPPVTTPFDSEGAVLIDRFKSNLDRWASFNLKGYLVLGSNGETPFLSEEEQLLLVRETRACIPASKEMIVGVGRESTRLCIQFTRKVADLGADYALVGTPCYYKPSITQDALFAHFWSVADESPIPILIYNVPQFTGVSVSASLIERLSAHENIAGMKESSANLALQGEIRRRAPQRFQILVGSASTLLPSLIQGACGGIVALACILPGETVDLFDAFVSGDWQRAARLQKALAPVATAVGSQFGIAGLKVAMDLMGYFGGHARLPLLALDQNQVAILKSVLEASGKLLTLQDG